MNRLLLRWILLAVSIVVAAKATSALGFAFDTRLDSFGDAFRLLLGAGVLSLLNATLGKLLKLLTLPLNCLTLGLFSLVINAAMLQVAGSLGMGFKVDNFWAALVGGIFISIVNAFLSGMLLRDKDDE